MSNTVRRAILCSDARHHSWPALAKWAVRHKATLTDNLGDLEGGDLLLLVSCTQFVPMDVRARYRSTFVIHESALPDGRGWSPLAWQVLEGRSEFTVSLICAEDEIDAGNIIAQETFALEGHELSDEINDVRDKARLGLMDRALESVGDGGREQEGKITRYPRRIPTDSRLDPHQSIARQFELLRICEPRFPAFFDFRGHRYEVEVRKSA